VALRVDVCSEISVLAARQKSVLTSLIFQQYFTRKPAQDIQFVLAIAMKDEFVVILEVIEF